MPEDTQDKPQVTIKGVDIKADEIQDFQVPSFVNYVYLSNHGYDVYIDLGLITIEQMAAFKPGERAEVKVECSHLLYCDQSQVDVHVVAMIREIDIIHKR